MAPAQSPASPPGSLGRELTDQRPPRWRDYLRTAGPGLVAGIADVDPTTVATVAVVGAGTGFTLSWLVVLMIPVLGVIQVISAKVGVVSGVSLQTAVRARYGRWPQWLLFGSIVGINIITLAADLEAGGSALGLLLPVHSRALVVPVAVVVLAMVVFGSFDQVQKTLTYLMLVMLAYPVAALLSHPNWGRLLHDTVVPHLSLHGAQISGALALLGTTLTGYVYVWMTIEQAEQHPSARWLRPRMADAVVGIVAAVAVFWFILVSTGATLGPRHVHITTAAQAARALRPVAGHFATVLFGVGLLGSALLALPVLMGTTAYVVGAQLDWRVGLSRGWRQAPRFYAVLAVSVLLGVVVGLAGVAPIRLLFFASILGGLATPVSLAILLLLAGDRTAMRGQPVGPALRILGWLVTVLVSAVGVVYLVQQL